jgi:hypothetical protein
MLFHRRNRKSVVKKSQEDRHSNRLYAGTVKSDALFVESAPYRGKPTTNPMTVMASSAAPNQSHCEGSESGSSSVISSSPPRPQL